MGPETARRVCIKAGRFDDDVITTALTLTFRATVPTRLFLGILKAYLNTALQPALQPALAGCFCVATALSFAGARLWQPLGKHGFTPIFDVLA